MPEPTIYEPSPPPLAQRPGVAKDIPTIGPHSTVRPWALPKPYVMNVSLPGGTDTGTYPYQVYKK
jgi:hypothetical protein